MKKLSLSIFAFLLLLHASYGQDNIGTPYSIFGYGLQPENQGPYAAMGGVSAAMRDNKNINFLNPASYTELDSMRFYFQAALSGEFAWISTHKESSYYNVAQNANLAMALRLRRNLYFSFGFTQKSDVGYDVLYSDIIIGSTSNSTFNQNIQGEGGLNDIYTGFGWKYKNLSLGINFAFVFGKLEKRQTLMTNIPNSYYIRTSENKRVHDFLFNPGIQYTFKLSPKSDLVLGSSMNFSQKLWAKTEFVSYKVNTSGATTMLENEVLKHGRIVYPFKITSGFNYRYKNKLQIAGDYTFNKMSAYEEYGRSAYLQDAHKAALGASWTPDAMGRFWRQRNTYMAGVYFNRSEARINDHDINTYGVSGGLQIPFLDQRTGHSLLLGIAVDLGMRGTEADGLVRETFAKLRIHLAFKEFWFMKRKID